MALTQDDLNAISGLIEARETQLLARMTNQINQAQFGGPTVQVAPKDLVYLGSGNYVSEAKGRMYGKGGGGRLIDKGPVPEPV